jgi:hypothetical protein
MGEIEKSKNKEKIKWYNYLLVPGGMLTLFLIIKFIIKIFRESF